MATVKFELEKDSKLSKEQEKMLKEAAKKPVVFDEDSPKLTEEQLKEFKRVREIRQEERRRQNVTLRLTPQAIRIAKSLGKGYTGVLSRIIEDTLSDPASLKRYL